VCNPREEGVASDNAGASVFVHNDDDKTNNQCVRVELIYVFDYYISQEEKLPSKVGSDAHFKPKDKAGWGKKIVGGGQLIGIRGLNTTM